ncbi:ras-responsive element-binding protein 1 isoform X4 [Octopus sinensis]|uniref:Ras-responsive element-binding protein 1 isoform X4 n=1 Tax=Octopus sinensis TaxID=2607531 RepID=A0A7E6EVY6_9MOLL|nr:ras-responsive element-binding protein 1 isoform X4 [Octopus sinensis]
MSRRKQSNPRPLLDFNRKKSPDASTQDQTSVHVGKFELQKSNGYVVAKSDEEPHAPLLMDAKSINSPAGVQLSSLPEHFILAPSKPSTSAGSNNCSPSQTTLSKHQLKMDPNAAAGKGKKSKIPAKRKSSGKIMPIDKNGNNIYECPQCKENLQSLRELTSHLRSHNGINNSRSDHECHQCHKILSSSSSLDRHMLTHSGEKPFSCTICTQSFTTNGNMHRHMRTHEKKNETKRNYLKLKQKGLGSRVGAYAGKNASSIPSAAKINDLHGDITSLWIDVHPKKIKPNSLTSPTNLIVPSTQPTQDAPQDLSQKSNTSLLQHDDIKREEFGDPYENSSLEITKVDFSTTKFPLMCVAQDKRSISRQKSFQHKYSCTQCSSTFPCQKALDLHYQDHFPDQPTSCSTCKVTFNSTEELKQHSLHYHQDRGKECQRAFMNSLNLTSCSGTRSVSPKSEISTSEIAPVNKRSNSESQLSGLESPKISFEEATSLKDFAESNLMPEKTKNDSKDGLPTNAHQSKAASLASKKKSSYTCTYCNQIFPNTRAAKSHERSHLGLSPYQCKSCSYSSPDKSTLIRHMRTHNGERPYQCKLCSYPFTTKANCERHVKKKHHISTKEELELKVSYNKESNKEVPNGEDAFSSPDTVCKYCNIDFKYFRHLKHHLRKHRSSEEKPFRCKECQMGFSTKANCMRHIQNKHIDIDHANIENYIIVQDPLLSSFAHGRLSPRSLSLSPIPSPGNNSSNNHSYLTPDSDVKPLDLRSSKNHPASAASPSANSSILDDDGSDEPIDLSVKKSKKSSRKTSKSTDPSSLRAKCNLDFQRNLDQQWHVNQPHNNMALPSVQQQEHLLKKSPQYVLQESNRISSPVAFDSDNGDLASVKQILSTAGANTFKEYMNPAEEDLTPSHANGHEDILSPDEYDSDLINKIKREPQDPEENEDNINLILDECNSTSLIESKETISQETDQSKQKSLKKKRNSYADSPHKLKCPYCPRNFPWASSLKRHILTHTENLRRHYHERHPNDPIPENVGYDPDEKILNLSSPSTDLLNNNDNNNNDNNRVNSYNETFHSTSQNNGEDFDGGLNVSNINYEIDKQGMDDEDLVNDENGEEMLPDNRHWSPTTAKLPIMKLEESAEINHSLLVKHRKDHEVDSPFMCYLCDSSFDERAKCLAHIEQQHNTQWQVVAAKINIDNIEYFCNKMDHIVSQRCKMSANVDASRKTDYLSRKVYCSFCAQRFWFLQDLRCHMRSHTVNNFIEENQDQSKSDSEINRTKGQLPMEIAFEESQEDCKSDILPEILGLNESDIEKMLENATSGGNLSYIASDK